MYIVCINTYQYLDVKTQMKILILFEKDEREQADVGFMSNTFISSKCRDVWSFEMGL